MDEVCGWEENIRLMSQERASVQFVKGAAILGVAGLVSKLLGAVYRIPYQNIAGDIGLYVYMQVYPLYTTEGQVRKDERIFRKSCKK